MPNGRAVTRNRIYGFMKKLASSSNALILSAVTSARYHYRIVRHKTLAGSYCMYISMVVAIANAVIVDQFSQNLVSFVVSIIIS